jgi:hypothetical protein
LLTSLKGIYVNVDVPANAASAGNVYRKNLVAPLSSVSGTAWDGSIGVFKGIPKSTVSHAFYATSNAASLLLASDNNLFDSNQVVLLNGANNEAAFYQQGTGPEWRLTATGWKQWNPAEAAANLVPATFSLYRLKETQPPLYSFSASTTTPLPWRGASGFASSAYTPYLIRFKAKFSSLVRIRPQFTAVVTGTTTTYTPIAFDTSTHWSGLAGLGTVIGSSGETLTYEGFVMPTSGATDTRYELGRVGGDTSSVGLLSAEVRKLEGYTVPSATTWMSLQSASRWAAKTIPDCAALGWSSGCQVIDMMGNPVSLPTTLPAGAVALYLNKNPAW